MATPRQKKNRRQGENVRAATARGFSNKRANMQGRSACNARKTAAGKNCQLVRGSFSVMPAASLWHIKDYQLHVEYDAAAQELPYRWNKDYLNGEKEKQEKIPCQEHALMSQ